MSLNISGITATLYYYTNQKTMLQESKQGTSNYKADERRKQVQKHYQIRTRDYLQEHWNYYYPETWNTRQYGYTEYPQHASERENEDKRHGGLNRS
jgi:hypothetical protein